jgi:hypothetical protein
VQIVYRVRNVQGAVSAQSVDQASLESPLEIDPASSEGRWKTARLKVEYPHPDAPRDMARATLVLSRGELPAPAQPTIGQRIAGQFNRLTSQGPKPECRSSGICATSSGPDDEIWVLDFPKQQLVLLLAELENTGFFASQSRPGGEAELAVLVDRDKTAKPWTPEPRLDDLVTRVFREGMLEGFMTVGLTDALAEDTLP